MNNNNQETLAEQWNALCEYIANHFEPEGDVDVDGVLFLIGVQELGQGYRRFKKDEKINLLHIAICRVLEPYGYYTYTGTDEEGWPHFELQEELPILKAGEQSRLMKEAILAYFAEMELP